MTSAPEPVAGSPPSPGMDAYAVERWGVVMALAAYVLVQVNAVLHQGYAGQDFFSQHVPLINRAMRDPWGFATVLTGWRTNPPLYYLLAAKVAVLSGRARAFEAIALLNVAVNVIGLVLLSRVLRRVIDDPRLRLACMVLVLFLPFAMIHAMVIACDAPAAAIFFLIAYLCVLLAEAASPGRVVTLGLAVGMAVVVGLGTKFTFVSTAAALTVLVPLLAWAKRWEGRTAFVAFVLAAAIPLVLGLAELGAYRRAIAESHFGPPKDAVPGMSLRSLVFFRPGDRHVFDAPPYDETVQIGSRVPVPATGSWEPQPGTEFNLLEPDRFSYPALLHLAVFTDICNFYQNRPLRRYFGVRSASHQARMVLAVRTGTLFSLATLLAVPLVTLTALRSCLRDRSPRAVMTLIPVLMGLAFYLGIVAVMPFATGAYGAGYWLPRLVAPSLLVFSACIFIALDRLPLPARRWAGRSGLALAVLQALLHVSFLWPPG
jgi:hypothetical protein